VKEPVWLARQIVEAIHFQQIIEHGGSHGIKSEYTLDSALARPQSKFAYSEDPDLALLAAAYGYGLIQGHPFIDGNKRTGFMAMYTFLGLNGYTIETTEAVVVEMILGIAQGAISEEELADWLRSSMIPISD